MKAAKRARAIAAVVAASLAFLIAQPGMPAFVLIAGGVALAGLAAADWSAILEDDSAAA